MPNRICIASFAFLTALCGARAVAQPPAAAGAVAVTKHSTVALPVEWRGTWRAYSDFPTLPLGKLTIREHSLDFSNRLHLSFDYNGSILRIVASSPKGSARLKEFCGDAGLRSMSIKVATVTWTAKPTRMLTLTFFDVASGPGSNPDFDPHNCGYLTYAR